MVRVVLPMTTDRVGGEVVSTVTASFMVTVASSVSPMTYPSASSGVLVTLHVRDVWVVQRRLPANPHIASIAIAGIEAVVSSTGIELKPAAHTPVRCAAGR